MKTITSIVTGAGRGIGRATAIRLGRSGGRVALVSRSACELQETALAVRDAGGEPLAIPADVAAETDVVRIIARTQERFGRIDVLVNNAGVAPLSPLPEMSVDSFDWLVAVNIRGVFLLCRAAWPIMASNGGGTIISISSVAARDPFPGFAAYGGTKAFVETFTRGMADEGRAVGIRAFAVAPGAVDTKMLRDLFPDFPAAQTLPADGVAALVESLATGSHPASSGETVTITG